MSNERQQRHSDPLVSTRYREVADEQTPRELDEVILRQAHSAAKPGYARIRHWSRPLAWAATIAISLAIVLQLTQLPKPTDEPALAETVVRTPALEKGEIAEYTKTVGAVEFDAIAVDDAPTEDPPSAGRVASSPASSNAELVPETVDMLSEAENMARMRNGSDKEVVQSAGVAAALAAEKKSLPQFCDDEARATAETWHKCVEELEEQGRQEDAIIERLAFDEAHPDY